MVLPLVASALIWSTVSAASKPAPGPQRSLSCCNHHDRLDAHHAVRVGTRYPGHCMTCGFAVTSDRKWHGYDGRSQCSIGEAERDAGQPPPPARGPHRCERPRTCMEWVAIALLWITVILPIAVVVLGADWDQDGCGLIFRESYCD